MTDETTPSGKGPRAATAERRIGPYRVLREIGRGGMGAVYLCEDTAVGDRPVALKVVLDHDPGDGEALERFKREIRNLGALRHRNLVQVLFAGEHEGKPYFVMEYVPGRDLSRWLAEIASETEAERVEAIVALMSKVCDAVAFAHRAGLVHRDLKPQNILVRDDGEPMVLDFGVSRRRGDASLTGGGAAPGTPAFMAPEQFEPALSGQDESADVWALGALLYLALTGERPFKGASLPSIAYHVVNTPPIAPRRLNPDVPEELEAVVLRALEKDPKRRFESVDHLRRALEAATVAGRKAKRSKRAAGVGLVVVGALVLVAAFLRPWENVAPRPTPTATLLSVEGRDVSFDRRTTDVATFEPTFVVALDGVKKGVVAEATLVGADEVEYSKVPLAPAGDVFEAAFRVGVDRRREGALVSLRVVANGEDVPVRPSGARFRIDATPPRVVVRVLSGEEAPREIDESEDATPPIVLAGSTLEITATDPGGVARFEWEENGRRGGPVDPAEGLRIPLLASGDKTFAVRVVDAAGNERRRTIRLVAASAAASKPETRATSRRRVVDLPDEVGSFERVGGVTNFAGPVPLVARDDIKVQVRHGLGAFEFSWSLRLRDSTGAVVAECALEPRGILAEKSTTTVAGVLDLVAAKPAPGAIVGEFVFRDADGTEATRLLPTRFEWRGPPPADPKPRVAIETSAGAFVVELDRAAAPAGVAVFLACVESGFFEGTIVHDVEKDGYVAAGRYTSLLGVKVDRSIKPAPNEFEAPKALRNVAGTIALARDPNEPDSARGRFVVNLSDQPRFDAAKFTVVGRVVEGLDVLRAIAASPIKKRGGLERLPEKEVLLRSAKLR